MTLAAFSNFLKYKCYLGFYLWLRSVINLNLAMLMRSLTHVPKRTNPNLLFRRNFLIRLVIYLKAYGLLLKSYGFRFISMLY